MLPGPLEPESWDIIGESVNDEHHLPGTPVSSTGIMLTISLLLAESSDPAQDLYETRPWMMNPGNLQQSAKVSQRTTESAYRRVYMTYLYAKVGHWSADRIIR
jgi:hypothetical protein